MTSRLDNIPVYEQQESTVAAADFNRVQIALKRLGKQLLIPLAGLRSLALILDQEAWIVVDRDLNEIPVLAWTGFHTEGRGSLHEPIPCVVKSYHQHAGMILQQVQDFMAEHLEEQLSLLQTRCELDNVTPLKRD